MLKKLHLVVGVAGFVAFVLTGQYMHWFHAHLYGMADGPRMIYRSSHIYLLWASLLNVGIGCYVRDFSAMRAKVAQTLGSVSIAVGPAMLCWSFFRETYSQDLARPLGRLAIYLSLAGIALHAAASLMPSAKNSET
jgi:hypothetical protein